MVVMVAMEPFKLLSMMVYLAFESVGMEIVVAEAAPKETVNINTKANFFM